jgi:predicted nucleic acid-binding protein
VSAIDTSVAVPALLSWHEHHELCRRAASGNRIPAHALIESYAVLTRLPPPHRIDASRAVELLSSWFPPLRVLTAPASLQRSVLATLGDAGIEGGASYDALIALTAQHHGEELLTRDVRARRTYDRIGVPYRLFEP